MPAEEPNAVSLRRVTEQRKEEAEEKEEEEESATEEGRKEERKGRVTVTSPSAVVALRSAGGAAWRLMAIF